MKQRFDTIHVGKNKASASASVPVSNVIDLRPQQPAENEKVAPAAPPAQPPKGPTRSAAAQQHVRSPRPSPQWPLKKTATFFLIAALLLIPLGAGSLWQQAHHVKGKVLGATDDAFATLVQASKALQSLDPKLAQSKFSDAEQQFRAAQQGLRSFRLLADSFSTLIPAAAKVRSGNAVVQAGRDIAEAGSTIADTLATLAAAKDHPETDFTQLVQSTQPAFASTESLLNDAVVQLAKVREQDIPEAQRPMFQNIASSLPQLSNAMKRLNAGWSFFTRVLGTKGTQRFLVLFQNNLEVRPTGGFIGSVALLDVADGKITKLAVPGGGSYDYKGQLNEKVIAPEPLHIVNPLWQLQDANWWPDFPTSAQKVMWFYEHSGGSTVDGVLAMTPDLMMNLLRITGPIDMAADYGVVINADNFLPTMLAAIDSTDAKPKQIIADLVPKVLDTIFRTAPSDAFSLVSTFEHAASEKQLLFYFPDAQQEATVKDLGWAGELRTAPKDYLAVIDSNIGGGKTDGVIDETIFHDATIANDGHVDVTVKIQRTHYGTENDPVTGARNIDYVRVYVPQGSVLQHVDGFEKIDPKRFQIPDADAVIDPDIEKVEGRPVVDELTGTRVTTEFGKTVFGNWIGIAPGESVTATITYRLPFRVVAQKSFWRTTTGTYSALFQKQSGAKDRHLVTTLHYPSSYHIGWSSSSFGKVNPTSEGLITATGDLTADQLLAFLFEPKQ